MARSLRLIGKNHCGLDAATLAQLDAICKRLDPGKRHQMTDRNRKKLAQFDDPANVAKLLHFPEREVAWALMQTNLFRRAKGFERAVAVSLLIFCGLRITTLRTLELSDLRFIDNGRCILFVPAERTKGDRALEHDLNPEVAALLRRFIEDHRPLLLG